MLRTSVAVFLFVSGLLLAISRPALAAEPAISPDFLRGQRQFALDLYHQLGQKSGGNLCFAPSSIQMALAMTYAGARGETAAQMAEVLRFNLPPEALHAAFASQLSQLKPQKSKPGPQLNVVNRLWGQKGYPFVPAFLKLTKDQYGAELGQVDFEKQTEAARHTINAWIAAETQDKIPTLLPQGAAKSRTRLVLTNALYFLGEWVYPFEERAMIKAPFHRATGEPAETSFMTQVKRLRHASHNGVQALELPYRGTSYSLVVLLPEQAGGLKSLEESLSTGTIDELAAKLKAQTVQVQLPPFKSRAQFDLVDALTAMGMPLPFSSSADFSGITTKEDVSISAVIHEAYVDVNKKGTEAAAATAVVADAAPAPPKRDEPVIFRADHPFIYLIRDSRSGNLLFVGRMADPQS